MTRLLMHFLELLKFVNDFFHIWSIIWVRLQTLAHELLQRSV